MAAKGSRAVFLNLPYDADFERLYLAHSVGLSALNLEPRTALALPGGEQRLSRIVALVDSCAYSIHDLSRVQFDRNPPCTPRFNMPFELGMAVARAGGKRKGWFAFEASAHRVCLRDLNGVDVHVHGGTASWRPVAAVAPALFLPDQLRLFQMCEKLRALSRTYAMPGTDKSLSAPPALPEPSGLSWQAYSLAQSK